MSAEIQIHKITRSNSEELQFDLPTFDAITTALPTGLYTTFRTYAVRTKVLGFSAHLDRLYLPAKMQDIHVARSREQLREILTNLLRFFGAGTEEARVRLIMDTTSEPGTFYVLLQQMQPLPPGLYEKGVRVEISRSSREKPALKQTAFISQSAADRKRVGEEVHEILLTQKGRILEGMTSNFFYVRDGVLFTAGRGVLIGVTRQTLLAMAKWEDIPVRYKALHVNELPLIDEAFISSSSRGVIPVVQVDAQPIRNREIGPITKRLMRLYDEDVIAIAEEIL